MKLTPIAKYAPPRYPDKYAPHLDSLLRSHVPLRWRSSPLAGTVLSAVIMLGLSSCAEAPGDYVTMGVPLPTPTDMPRAATPIFEHGMGVGTFGCVSVAAPVFLSEADAYAIISDEFAKIGFTVEQGGGTVENVQLPVTSAYQELNGQYEMKTENGSLDFDFHINGMKIEYISSADFQRWTNEEAYLASDGTMMMASVSTENYLETAKTLNDSLNAMDLGQVHGVFYEPAEYYEWREDDEQAKQEAAERAQEQLRAQVKDFIEWLAAQGVI